MKKLLLLILITACTVSVQAQIASSSSRSTTTTVVEKEKTTISYIRAGINFGKLSGTMTAGEDIKDKRKTGYSFMYGFNKSMGTQGLYWGMEFGLGSRGLVQEYSYDEQYEADKLSISMHNIQVSPFNIGYKYEVINNLKVDVHFGTYISCDYAGKLKYEDSYYDETIEESIWDISGDYVVETYTPYDIGLVYGFGVWYKDRFNLDFNFQSGFIGALYDADYYNNSKTRNFTIRLGVAF